VEGRASSPVQPGGTPGAPLTKFRSAQAGRKRFGYREARGCAVWSRALSGADRGSSRTGNLATR